MRSVTVISAEKVRAIATKLGLEIKDKKSEFKVFGKEAGISKSIAVPNTKGGATRIYLVGFNMEGTEGFVAHPKPPAKTVTQMVDHSLEERLVLKAIYTACKRLAAKPVEQPASSPEATETKQEPSETISSPTEAPVEQVAEVA